MMKIAIEYIIDCLKEAGSKIQEYPKDFEIKEKRISVESIVENTEPTLRDNVQELVNELISEQKLAISPKGYIEGGTQKSIEHLKRKYLE